ncbi:MULTISPECIES: hypothetical protein [Streptomyces]|uniref:hypothetical protein n=1 Tax=Streptomyces TaxID=1883 RepID=UPI002473994D|nr:hypothetical protein [Streptomyces sp. MAA16]MDH6703116.1 hypothetical protein [Streptomyces sp. MAA16]
MPRTPARVLSSAALAVLAATALPTTAGCSAGPPAGGPAREGRAHASPAPSARSSAPAAPAAGALTDAQAHAALVTPADLGDPWTPTQGAATWRDSMLKATADAPDCRRLLDALYTDDLFDAAPGTRAVIGLDDSMDEAQLRYQVLALPRADVDRTLAWLKALPGRCRHFTAKGAGGATHTVEVTEAKLPDVGDARQGLRVTLTGPAGQDDAQVLTLDVAAVRVGDDTITVTDGGLGDVSADVTGAVAQLGTQRLAEVRKQGRVQI